MPALKRTASIAFPEDNNGQRKKMPLIGRALVDLRGFAFNDVTLDTGIIYSLNVNVALAETKMRDEAVKARQMTSVNDSMYIENRQRYGHTANLIQENIEPPAREEIDRVDIIYQEYIKEMDAIRNDARETLVKMRKHLPDPTLLRSDLYPNAETLKSLYAEKQNLALAWGNDAVIHQWKELKVRVRKEWEICLVKNKTETEKKTRTRALDSIRRFRNESIDLLKGSSAILNKFGPLGEALDGYWLSKVRDLAMDLEFNTPACQEGPWPGET